MSTASPSPQPFRVVIAGGGVAALEAALALRELAGERVATMMVAPDPEFICRPMTVREPFAQGAARRYPLVEIARDIGVELRADSLQWLDASAQAVHTHDGHEFEYDALLLAMGARMHARFKHALTLDDRRLDQQMHGLIQDVEGGYVHRVAFLIPSPTPWPLPIYELALMTAGRAYDMNVELSITITTPEDAPLAIFGANASATVQRLLDERGITTITSASCEVPEPGRVSIHPGWRDLRVDRIVALPELFGPSTPGVPTDAPGGFIPVDGHGKVKHLERVYAAGDVTDFAIKHGGIAAQQADAAAEAIAALAGAPIEPSRFDPVIHGILLGADRPLYLSAHVTGGHGSRSQLTDTPTWSPPTKIDAKYLTAYLDARDRAAPGAEGGLG